MSAAAEARFLARERETAEGFFKPEYLAYVSQKRAELEHLVTLPPSAAIGRKLPAVAGSLHTTLAAEGMRALFAGRTEGFGLLRDAQVFAYWEAVVYEAAFQRDTAPDRFRRGHSIKAFAYCLLAWHLGAEATAEAIMSRLVAESHDSVCTHWAASTAALPFMARLYEQARGEALDLDWSLLPALEGYQALLDPELKGQKYLEALDWACEQHIAQTNDSKSKFMPFAIAVLAPMPVELITWLTLRRRAGLEHGTHGHPLLESLLATLDPPIVEGRAEVLRLYERGEPHLRAYLNAG